MRSDRLAIIDWIREESEETSLAWFRMKKEVALIVSVNKKEESVPTLCPRDVLARETLSEKIIARL